MNVYDALCTCIFCGWLLHGLRAAMDNSYEDYCSQLSIRDKILYQGLVDFFYKGPGSKNFWFSESHAVSVAYSSLFRFFLQSFTNVKTILSFWAVQKGLLTRFGPWAVIY